MRHFLFEIYPAKTNERIVHLLISTQKEFNRFFRIQKNIPQVYLVNSRKDYDSIAGRKTESWSVGHTKNNSIFILHPKIYTKESDHKNPKDFWKTLKHELSHLYYWGITHSSYPRWLNEGLACYLAKQIKKDPDAKEALKVIEYFSKNDFLKYRIGTYWVKFLIKKYGRKKLLQLINKINNKTTKKQFANIFYTIFKIHFTKKGLEKIIILKTKNYNGK